MIDETPWDAHRNTPFSQCQEEIHRQNDLVIVKMAIQDTL